MEAIKTTSNLEFDVIYADNTRKRVQEGILVEAEGVNLTLHLGTNRVEMLFATIEALFGTLEELGLSDAFEKYLESGIMEEKENE